MKYSTRLIYTLDNKIGELGWKVKRFPFFDATDAQGLAHDILEHSRNDKGTWYEEIAAFGSIIAYRGNMSDLLYPRERTVHDKIIQLGKELAGILERPALDNPRFFKKINDVNNKDCSYKNYKSYKDAEYVDLLAKESSILLKYLSGSTTKQTEDCLISWISHGYTRASRIIESSGWEGHYIWETVEYAIKCELFDSGRDFYEGNEVSVQIDFENLRCDVVPTNCKKQFN